LGGLILRVELKNLFQVFTPFLIRVGYAGHPEPGQLVVHVGLQNIGQYLAAGDLIAGLDGLNSLL
jgi:hypothetical protein